MCRCCQCIEYCFVQVTVTHTGADNSFITKYFSLCLFKGNRAITGIYLHCSAAAVSYFSGITFGGRISVVIIIAGAGHPGVIIIFKATITFLQAEVAVKGFSKAQVDIYIISINGQPFTGRANVCHTKMIIANFKIPVTFQCSDSNACILRF